MSVQRKKLEKRPGQSVTQRVAAEAEAAQQGQEAPPRTRKPAAPRTPVAPEPPKRVVRVPLSTRVDIDLEETMTLHQAHTRTSKQTMVEEGVRLYLRQEGYDV